LPVLVCFLDRLLDEDIDYLLKLFSDEFILPIALE